MMTEMTPPTEMTDATSPRRYTREWRIIKHYDYVQPHWFWVNTTLARTIALSLRALAKVTPEDIATLGVGATLELPLDPGAGCVLIKKLGKGQCKKHELPFKEALAIIAPGATGVMPSQQERNRDLFIVPTSIVAAIHARKDPVFATQQMVSALLAMVCGASRDNDLQKDRSRLFYESARGPKRMLFVMVRGHDADMQKHWRAVRELLSQVYFRREPLIRRHDGELDPSYDLRDLGPFRKEEMVAWRISRHVFEDTAKRDANKKQGKTGAASMGTTSVDPTIFQSSATGIVDQLALHVHRALNASTKDLPMAVFEHTSGRAMARTRRPRPSRRRARAERPVSLAIKRGTFKRRAHDEQQIPILRRVGRAHLLAFTSPRSSAADT